jgi:hypothetical protein
LHPDITQSEDLDEGGLQMRLYRGIDDKFIGALIARFAVVISMKIVGGSWGS